MSDFNKPTAADSYATDLLPNLRDNVSKCATMNFGGATNIPINTVQFQAGAFARWNGLNWVPAPISVAGGGLGGTSLAEARKSLNVNEKGTGGAQVRTNAESDLLYTPQTRQVNVSGAVTGGGTLEDNVNITVRGATTSQTGVVQLNNTLTSTSTSQALTAAQGKVLKDDIDAIPSVVDVGYYNSATLGASGDFTSGNCKVVRVGDMVTISGFLFHSSSTTADSASGYIPSWARPDNKTYNDYLNRFVDVDSSGVLGTAANLAVTNTAGFTISYTV